ncbi:hypothetical protein ACFQXB_14875 [Plastorhodobacter daqingensis]|uniref:Uncharacterized protein n=1 Tax=Plastorhodobacter daqingensis TaxID=1387281 RepID=A0ABW2UPK8_9RHOB
MQNVLPSGRRNHHSGAAHGRTESAGIGLFRSFAGCAFGDHRAAADNLARIAYVKHLGRRPLIAQHYRLQMEGAASMPDPSGGRILAGEDCASTLSFAADAQEQNMDLSRR